MNIQYLLRQTEWFKGLSEENRKAMEAICIRKAIRKKEILFLEGERGEALFLLAQGAIQLYKTTPSGAQVVIKMVKPGEIFAEVVLFEEDKYPVTAVALKESQLYLLPKRKFSRLLSREDFQTDFIRALLRKHRYLTTRIVYLTSREVEGRLFLFLKEHFGPKEEIIPSLSKKDVAAAIGATPETFSRLLLKLKQQKVLIWEDKKIRLKKGFWEHAE